MTDKPRLKAPILRTATLTDQQAKALKLTCSPSGIFMEEASVEPPPEGIKYDPPCFYTTVKQREAMDKVHYKMKMKSKERVQAALAAQLSYDALTPEEQEVYLVEFQNRIDNPSDETKQAYASLAGPGTAPND